VVGGGYIGLEIGLVYAGLGSRVSLAEFQPRLLAGADPDLVDVVVRYCRSRFEEILLDSKVEGIEPTSAGYAVTLEQRGQKTRREYERVLVAVGRHPNTAGLGLELAGIEVDARGLVPVDEAGRTRVPHIFAIGDITAGPALAHKASREGRVAAEVIAGLPSALDHRAVPAVVFTDPEIAWTGLTEREATERGIPIEVSRFPLTALGRARTLGRTEGFFKVLFEKGSGLVRGVAIVAPHASELISEGTLAIEMGATLEDLAATIHPHPTLSEALMEAAELGEGHAIHLAPRRR
jgi:dihydrolipoamide dehydrogenase